MNNNTYMSIALIIWGWKALCSAIYFGVTRNRPRDVSRSHRVQPATQSRYTHWQYALTIICRCQQSLHYRVFVSLAVCIIQWCVCCMYECVSPDCRSRREDIIWKLYCRISSEIKLWSLLSRWSGHNEDIIALNWQHGVRKRRCFADIHDPSCCSCRSSSVYEFIRGLSNR